MIYSNRIVSIIVPCYNQARYLDEALQSVMDQTFVNWECIIVNDGSPDHTEEVAQEWVKKDSRFIYLYKENGGLCSARNAGIEIAKGEFILPLDADDKIAPDYVSLAMHSFHQDATLKLVYCKAEKFGDEIGLWQLPEFSLKGLSQENMIFCTAFFNRKDWELVGGYDVNMIYGLEDWEFWIAILKNGGTVKCLDQVGFYYRIKSNSMIKELNSEKRKVLFDYLSTKHYDFFIEHLGSFLHLNERLLNANTIILKNKEQNRNKLQSKKFVINLFCKTFFGFSIFGKHNSRL